MQRGLLFEDVIQDLRIGIRSLLRAPVLTLTIIVTVGLGLGATAAIFGAVNAALLRPLPYAEPEQLVRIYTDTPPFKFRFSVADYLALHRTADTFRAERHVHRSRGQLPERRHRRTLARTRGVVGVLLRARHRAVIGRDFTEQDGGPAPAGGDRRHGFWQQRLGGRADVVGQAGPPRRRRVHPDRRACHRPTVRSNGATTCS